MTYAEAWGLARKAAEPIFSLAAWYKVGCSAEMRWDRIISYGNDSIDDMD